jgi:hypothetical protein
MNTRFSMTWFCSVSVVLMLVGIVFAFWGLGILPVNRDVLLHWESAIYGAIMIGWGMTLFLVGRIAFRKNDAELMLAMLWGLALWLAVEALFSAFLHVFFNVGVDIAVFALFAIPLIRSVRYINNKSQTRRSNIMETYKIPNAMLKLGGVAAMAAALVMIAGFLIHPAGEDATHGTDPHWIPAHALLWLGFTLALIGWIGLYIAHASKAGTIGVISTVIVILGTSFASWIFSSDVTFVPVIAAESPLLFKKIFTTRHIMLGIVSVLT